MQIETLSVLDEIIPLLETCELKSSDIDPAAPPAFSGVRVEGKLVAVIGFERFDGVGLLRSLAVAPEFRGQGYARALVAEVEQSAREQGVQSLYLLTTSAAGFFARLGYVASQRETAPAAIRETAQFAGLCPSSSALLVKCLSTGTCACRHTLAPHEQQLRNWLAFLALALPLWLFAYWHLTDFADALIALFGLTRSTHLGEALHFFFYDTPKVLLLLTGIVFVMGIIQTFFAPERTRALLSGKRLGLGNVLAATLGIVTPFCSCSAVPLFIGFLSAGVPLGVTFSFLISAPMVNEVALVLLFGLFGWKVAALYLGLGLGVAIVAGLVIGQLKMENHLEDWVRAIVQGEAVHQPDAEQTWAQRFEAGRQHVREIVGKVWPYVLAGIALGAGIHGYVPEDFMASIMGRDAWWSVPVAVLLGVPMYTNAAGIIPIVEALIGKGAALGAVLAFMMAVIALSAPEMIILRKVLKPRLIAVFAGVVACGIVLVGYVFNAVI